MSKIILVILTLALLVAGCGTITNTGDSANDAASASRFVPLSLPGYNVTEATSVTDALSKAGIGASVLTGNFPMAGAIAKLDGLIQCYRGVGAVSARIYTEQNIGSTLEVPKVGALAVVNTTRLGRNFLNCAISMGGGDAQAQGAGDIQPCGGSGSFQINGENLEYVFGATSPELCSIFQSQMPA